MEASAIGGIAMEPKTRNKTRKRPMVAAMIMRSVAAEVWVARSLIVEAAPP